MNSLPRQPLVNYRHKRDVCVEMTAGPDLLLFASVYMTFFDASKRLECIAATNETIAMLEEVLSDHPRHKVIISDDFNTKFKGSLSFDILWRELICKHNLTCCDQYISNNNNYTYSHDSLNQRKWNDHFLVSSSIVPATDKHVILDVGDNP